MAKQCNDTTLKREGTAQSQRFLDALTPESLKLNDFSTEDWVLFAYNFANHINFFETSDYKIPAGNWKDLFNLFGLSGELPFRGTTAYDKISESVKETLDEFTKNQSLTPHFTLFICFLELLSLSKDRFNQLTKRHLDFYFKQVLQIDKLLPKPDQAHIIFELAKRIEEYKVDIDTKLDAGKDKNGANLVFKTVKELIANKATVTSLKSIYNDTKLGEIRSAQVANSHDGAGTDFPGENTFWHPFGYTSEQNEYPQLVSAPVGFAIASPMLNLNQGERNVAIKIEFESGKQRKAIVGKDVRLTATKRLRGADANKLFRKVNSKNLLEQIEVYYTSDKKWIGPISLENELAFIDGGKVPHKTEMTSTSMTLLIQLDRDMKPLSGFNSEIHDGNYNTTSPLVKIIYKTENEKGYEAFREIIHKPLATIGIEVSVTGITSMSIENDSGTLKPEKPFFPFTTRPNKRSNFYIDYPEAFSKNWSKITAELLWKDTPALFKKHYFAYRGDDGDTNSTSSYFDSIFTEKGSAALRANAINQPEDGERTLIARAAAPEYVIDPNPDNLIVPSESHFKATSSVLNKEIWDNQDPSVNLFTKKNGLHYTDLNITNKNYEVDKSGPIKLSLNQSFLHDLFPKIYALALSSENPDTLVPNSPYTPFVESITLSYSAEESSVFTEITQDSYDSNRISLFHVTPFGQHEEHGFLKANSVSETIFSEDLNPKINWLVPDYCHGGELYIGLSDAQTLQTISLLCQILEGSENPEADSFVGNQGVEWSVLCNNHWKDLKDYIVTNNIDNFLKSGIVSFSIPKQATNENTRLPSDYTWIKAKIHKEFDAVCKVIDIKAQAVLTCFEDNNNELSHLESGLAGSTIAKLVNRVPQIKSVSQPFSTFGGRPLEEDALYYRRVSERLRHKNRAITIWDYEHLILQEFPEIFKVLCLKHTKGDSFLSPGNVTVVVIPDIINKNVFDILQPRVSKATLNKVQEYINELNSMHVDAQVINPDYEEITVSLNVKFHKGFDESFYSKELNLDIRKFLSPWAFDSTKNIVFGAELHTSVIIDYLEDLPYIDYLEDVKISKNQGVPEKSASPSKPGAILVSAEEHIVKPIKNICKDTPIEAVEECQY